MHSCHGYASIFIAVLSRSKHDIRQSFASRKWEQWITLNIVADCMGSFLHYFKRNAHHGCLYATLFQCQIYIPSLVSGANSKQYEVDTVEPSYYGRQGGAQKVSLYTLRGGCKKERGRGRKGKGKGGPLSLSPIPLPFFPSSLSPTPYPFRRLLHRLSLYNIFNGSCY